MGLFNFFNKIKNNFEFDKNSNGKYTLHLITDCRDDCESCGACQCGDCTDGSEECYCRETWCICQGSAIWVSVHSGTNKKGKLFAQKICDLMNKHMGDVDGN